MGEIKIHKSLVGKHEGKRSFYIGVHGTIILKWVSGKQGWRVWVGFMWLRLRTGCGLL
jgi:hypothetical protein